MQHFAKIFLMQILNKGQVVRYVESQLGVILVTTAHKVKTIIDKFRFSQMFPRWTF